MKRLTLPADTAKLKELLRFVDRELDRAGCPDRVRFQIELAAEELFVNIANYAYSSHALSGEVGIECETVPDGAGKRITIGFTDRGAPYNPLGHADPDIDLPLENRAIGGLGILIVKRLMDTIEYNYDDGQNHLIIKKSW